MKKLLILAPVLAWSGVATAQQTESEADQCTPANQPVIERVDVGESSEDGNTLAVSIQAAHPSGDALNYDFRSDHGSISGSGSGASWNVSGEGPFYATVEVSGAGSACTVLARLTYERNHGGDTTGEGGE